MPDLLSDLYQNWLLIILPGDNSQSVRLIRFTDVQEILNMATTLKAYIQEAIELEKAGFKVNFKEKTALVLPEELLQLFKENPALKVAFEALTPVAKEDIPYTFLHLNNLKHVYPGLKNTHPKY